MKSIQPAPGAYLVDMPAELIDHDEKPYLDACPPPVPSSDGFVALDFSKVQRINGLGASMLVKLSVLAAKRRQKLVAFGLSDHHRAVFELTGLGRAMRVCRDMMEAFEVAGLPGPGGRRPRLLPPRVTSPTGRSQSSGSRCRRCRHGR